MKLQKTMTNSNVPATANTLVRRLMERSRSRRNAWAARNATTVVLLVAAGLLLYEHLLVKADDFSRLDAAFFTMNGVISIVFLGFVFTERLLR